MAQDTNITISPPRMIDLGCRDNESGAINCGHAFPDLARHQDHFYLAFRSAPSHFPSKKSRIQIYRSADAQKWQAEHSISGELDIRDPQFLAFKEDLYMFYMSHSMQLFNHEPVHIYFIKRTADGWTEPVALPFKQSGFWNVKTRDDKVYISVYTRNGEQKRRVKRHFALYSSIDLKNWRSVFTSSMTRERLRSYQTSESSFSFDAQGNIFGTIRSLIYPNINFAIDPDMPADWDMQVDRFKCDGPKLFTHREAHYLVARRSIFYRLHTEPFRLFNGWRNLVNIVRYSLSKKRTALYRFDPQTLKISHIRDLPSHGDTGYSAVAPMDDNRFLLVYYSSPLENRNDHDWLRGQITGGTRLYAVTLSFS